MCSLLVTHCRIKRRRCPLIDRLTWPCNFFFLSLRNRNDGFCSIFVILLLVKYAICVHVYFKCFLLWFDEREIHEKHVHIWSPNPANKFLYFLSLKKQNKNQEKYIFAILCSIYDCPMLNSYFVQNLGRALKLSYWCKHMDYVHV